MKSFKKLWILFVSVVLSVSILVTGTVFASADPVAVPAEGTVSYGAWLPSAGKKIVKDAAGKTYELPKADSVLIGTEVNFGSSAAKVRTPKGKLETISNGTYKFREVGYYSLILSNGYEGLRVECVADGASLKIDEASVPSYVATGAEVALPAAIIADAEGQPVSEEEAAKYKIETTYVSPENSTLVAVSNGSFTAGATSGSYFVRYTATKYDRAATETGAVEMYSLIKDFTVNAQKEFEDTEKPTLTVTGVPNIANVRTKVTLPTATTKDNFDERVKVEITVKAPDGQELKYYEEDGYLLVEKEGQKVVFDNDQKMTFYPDQIGKYIVTYKATDDAGNTTEAPKAIEVKDGKAPVIVPEDENLIPAEWGLSTSTATGSVQMRLPVATAYDNLPFEGSAYTANAKLQIKDPNGDFIYNEDADTVVNVSDCVSTVTIDGTLVGYDVNLAAAGKGSGTYTVVYRSQDALKQASTKTYKVTVSDQYSVTKAPTINVTKTPDFLTVGTEITSLSDLGITATSEASASSTKNAPKVSTAETTLVYDNRTIKLSDLQTKSLMLTENKDLVVTVTAKDPLGNSTTATAVTIPVLDFTKPEGSSSVSVNTTIPNSLMGDKTLADLDKSYDFLTAVTDNLNGGTDNAIKVAGSTNVGFEVYVAYTAKNADAATLEATPAYVESTVTYLEETTNSGKNLYITSIQIAKDRLSVGYYTVNVRSFDRGYTEKIWVETVEITGNNASGEPDLDREKAAVTSVGHNAPALFAANDGTVSAYNAKYLTKRTTDNNLLGRVIKGSRYSVMGNYMIPMTSGQTYSVDSYPATLSGSTYKLVTEGASGTRYPLIEKFTTQTDSGLSFAIYDAYDSYYAKDSVVRVPRISVVSSNGAVVEFKVSVKSPDGSTVTDFYGNEGGTVIFDETTHADRYFKATSNGVYVVTYSASTATGGDSTTINITVGDIVKPELIVKTAAPTTLKIGSKFKFSALEATDNITENSKLKYSRTLLLPDGSKDDISDEDVYTEGTAEATLNMKGSYTVIYTVTDEAGNTLTEKYTIVVFDKAAAGSASKTVTIVLIVVVILLIVGLLIYFFVFRKIDFDKRKKKKASQKGGSKQRAAIPARVNEEERVRPEEEPEIEEQEEESTPSESEEETGTDEGRNQD